MEDDEDSQNIYEEKRPNRTHKHQSWIVSDVCELLQEYVHGQRTISHALECYYPPEQDPGDGIGQDGGKYSAPKCALDKRGDTKHEPYDE